MALVAKAERPTKQGAKSGTPFATAKDFITFQNS
jgi:hypothetical protein